MKKIAAITLALAAAITITASAMVTTPPQPPAPASSTRATTTRATSTQIIGTHREEQTPNKKDKEPLTKKQIKAADATCAKAAIQARDVTVSAALQKYTSDWIATITKRTAAQMLAFDKSGADRVKANRAARIEATKAQEIIQKELKKTRNAAWDTFRTTVTSCGFETDSLED